MIETVAYFRCKVRLRKREPYKWAIYRGQLECPDLKKSQTRY
jgi:hypothetical protein